LSNIEDILQGKELKYIVINHMEPDHTGMIGEIVRRYPQVQIVGNSKTFKMVDAFFGHKTNLFEVNDNTILDLGYHKLKFVITPWVHWPETMVTYDTTQQILFSCDAFGTFGALDGGIFDDEIDFEHRYQEEMLRYYSNIVGRYSNMVQKAFVKLSGIPIKYICPSHGPVWREDPMKVIGLYDRWSKHESEKGVVIAFASMYGHTQQMADYIARKVAENGVKQIYVYDVSKTHISYILKDIWKFRGVILGSCAYNSGMHPMMLHLCNELEVIMPKSKVFGLFGSCCWGGGGVRCLQSFTEKMGWEEAATPIEVVGSPTLDKLCFCDAFVKNLIFKM
jgi:flavorubredoxin